MFEDSLLESQNRLVSQSRRWITAGSVSLQCLIAAAIVAMPFVRPEALAFRTSPPTLVVPPLRKPPVPIKRSEVVQRIPGVVSLPSIESPAHIPKISFSPQADLHLALGEPTPVSLNMMGDSRPGGGTALFGSMLGSGPIVRPAPPRGPLRISAGISSGMLLSEIRPTYPPIAKAAHVSGTVVIEATISKSGTIESAHVVSGPALLQGAAIDAVRTARYKPYRLNGDPTEVQTTITVVFRMDG